MNQIQDYQIIPVGRSKDLTNQVFGDYKVLYRTAPPLTSKSQQAHWLCQCIKCKKYIVKPAFTLTKGQNLCDCRFNLTNKRFGRWTVLYKTDKRANNRNVMWHCKCDCGNEKDVSADLLKRGESKSCGCLNKERISQLSKSTRIDLTGQRFGKLVALYPIYSGAHDKHTMWHCKCDCGNECDIDMGNLRAGKSLSCGCTISHQEEHIIRLLTQNNIPFSYQHIFSNFTDKRFDFFVDNKYIIEYDGSQHFIYKNSGWNTKENFERIRQNDLIKNKYCFNHNIPLIRIPYDVEYTLNDLRLETTRFLLTPENEQEYYNVRLL